MIDQSTVQRIFDAAEIVDVISDFVTLKKRGVNYLGACPFHNEKTPSFTVSPSKGIYKCFGCGKGGNSVNFIMEHEHLDYVGALKYLAKKYNIEIQEKELSPEQVQQKNDRESMMIINSFAQKYFIKNLHEHNEGKAVGLSYLRERGFRDDTISKFQLGYCTEEWDELSKTAQKEGYKKEYLIKTGLSIERENGLLDRFRGRVIFPIHGVAGRVLGFGGRTLKKDAKAAKYLNSPESEVYHKSRELYGIFFAKKSIVKNDKCYLVEGYTDLISMHQAGIENVTASSGTALTVDQIRLIKRFTNNITIIYDGDDAGIKASLRGIDLILKQGVNVKIIQLPDGEDPDSFSRKMNSAKFIQYIENKEADFIVFKTNLLLADVKDDPVKRANLIINIVQSIAIIPNTIIRSVYVKKCSGILNVDEKVLHSEINKIIRKNKNQTLEQEQRNKQKTVNQTPEKLSKSANLIVTNTCDTEERLLIRHLLVHGQEILFSETNEHGVTNTIKVGSFIISELQRDDLVSINPLYKQVFQEYSEKYTEKDNIKNYFRDHHDEKISRLIADVISEPYQLSNIWTRNDNIVEPEKMKLKELVPKLVNEYKMKKLQIMIKTVEDEIKKADVEKNTKNLTQLIEQKMRLDKVKTALSCELGNRIIL